MTEPTLTSQLLGVGALLIGFLGAGTPNFDPETGEILDGEQIPQNEQNSLRGAENDLKRYTQKMTLEVYFVDTAEKDRFKATLEQAGFKFKENYQVSGYQRIEPLTQTELNEQCGW